MIFKDSLKRTPIKWQIKFAHNVSHKVDSPSLCEVLWALCFHPVYKKLCASILSFFLDNQKALLIFLQDSTKTLKPERLKYYDMKWVPDS